MGKQEQPPGLRIRRGRWHYRFVVDGVEYARSTRLVASQRNVKAALAAMEAERRRVLEGDTSSRLVRIPFSDAAMLYLDWAKHEYPRVSTVQRFAGSLSSLRSYFDRCLMHQLTAGMIEDYKTWRRSTGIREVTLHRDLLTLRGLIQYGKKQRWLRTNPMDGVTMPSLKDAIRQHVVTPAEEIRYFAAAAAQPDLHDVAQLILLTGMRPSEVLHLRKGDIRDGVATIRESKTRAGRRSIVLVPAALAIIQRRMAGPGAWLFPSSSPELHRKRIGYRHDLICASAGVSFVLYDLRHTFATRMAEAGCPPATLASILGHSGLGNLHRYVHPSQEAQDAAMRQYGAAGAGPEEARA